jgi:hypothetical protein
LDPLKKQKQKTNADPDQAFSSGEYVNKLKVISFSVADPHRKNADADPGKNLDADPDADSCSC